MAEEQGLSGRHAYTRPRSGGGNPDCCLSCSVLWEVIAVQADRDFRQPTGSEHEQAPKGAAAVTTLVQAGDDYPGPTAMPEHAGFGLHPHPNRDADFGDMGLMPGGSSWTHAETLAELKQSYPGPSISSARPAQADITHIPVLGPASTPRSGAEVVSPASRTQPTMALSNQLDPSLQTPPMGHSETAAASARAQARILPYDDPGEFQL